MIASDPMGAAALKAASMASKFDFHLLGAACPDLDRDTRMANLQRVFAMWPKICRAMAALESVAPNAAASGAREDAKMMDFIEALPARQQGLGG